MEGWRLELHARDRARLSAGSIREPSGAGRRIGNRGSGGRARAEFDPWRATLEVLASCPGRSASSCCRSARSLSISARAAFRAAVAFNSRVSALPSGPRKFESRRKAENIGSRDPHGSDQVSDADLHGWRSKCVHGWRGCGEARLPMAFVCRVRRWRGLHQLVLNEFCKRL